MAVFITAAAIFAIGWAFVKAKPSYIFWAILSYQLGKRSSRKPKERNSNGT